MNPTKAETGTCLIAIEPSHRLVVLGRTLDATSEQAERALDQEAIAWRQLGSTCLGRGLYRHGSIFRGQCDAAVWNHAEFTYFRDFIPGDVVDHLVRSSPVPGVNLLRAEILLTTPGSFVFPTHWSGSSHRPDRRPSIEYLDVHPSRLADYRDIMHYSIGPAAAKLVAMGTLGTFRSMETAAVLLQDPSLRATWNQIHLSEVVAEGFRGFGAELDAALRETVPDGRFADVFAGLNDMRTIPRWTLNVTVLEDDAAVGQWARPRK
ncbi:hypothetical protein [Bosea sp. (in: a-proteobacteria)]|uniref:hypothetical protein n=1 Tax=Bosea sp. (in: a-proteobacteria) TaxID=1871050 RepID=UPI0025BFCA6A|nr:hypothetical protein [Bosea sp. (in: a-proteobacteria)]